MFLASILDWSHKILLTILVFQNFIVQIPNELKTSISQNM